MKEELLLFCSWKKKVPVDGYIHHTHINYNPETHIAIIPFSTLCGGSCVCFNVLMDNRQIKRMYSGSV